MALVMLLEARKVCFVGASLALILLLTRTDSKGERVLVDASPATHDVHGHIGPVIGWELHQNPQRTAYLSDLIYVSSHSRQVRRT